MAQYKNNESTLSVASLPEATTMPLVRHFEAETKDASRWGKRVASLVMPSTMLAKKMVNTEEKNASEQSKPITPTASCACAARRHDVRKTSSALSMLCMLDEGVLVEAEGC